MEKLQVVTLPKITTLKEKDWDCKESILAKNSKTTNSKGRN